MTPPRPGTQADDIDLWFQEDPMSMHLHHEARWRLAIDLGQRLTADAERSRLAGKAKAGRRRRQLQLRTRWISPLTQSGGEAA